ncbi:dethiobiotin synthase [Salidesulfovibrio brasiliensis]
MIRFVTGIDTGVGKTVATGLMLRDLLRRGVRASAMKLVQTGLAHEDGDTQTFARLSGARDLPECPACFDYPAAPDLAAALEGRSVEPDALVGAVEDAAAAVETLLVEGAGGLAVPLTPQSTVLDLLERTRWPVVLVTSARLGGINHTLLSLEALAGRGAPLAGLVFNEQPAADDCMRDHALETFRRGLRRFGFPELITTMPALNEDGHGVVSCDFASLFR